MDKYEFSNGLRRALGGKLDPVAINSNVEYYENYIDSEIRKGRSEADVLKSLGDPRIIARTIVDGASIEDASVVHGPGPDDGHSFRGGRSEDSGKKTFYFNIPPMVSIVIGILIFMLAITLITRLAPLILIILFVLTLMKWFKKR